LLKGDKTLAELSENGDVRSSQINARTPEHQIDAVQQVLG
jgi:hypothetical protein